MALFWVITKRVVAISYRRFGTTCLAHLQGSRIEEEKEEWGGEGGEEEEEEEEEEDDDEGKFRFLTIEDRTDKFSRNVVNTAEELSFQGER